MGVVSKNIIGDRRILASIRECKIRDEWTLIRANNSA